MLPACTRLHSMSECYYLRFGDVGRLKLRLMILQRTTAAFPSPSFVSLECVLALGLRHFRHSEVLPDCVVLVHAPQAHTSKHTQAIASVDLARPLRVSTRPLQGALEPERPPTRARKQEWTNTKNSACACWKRYPATVQAEPSEAIFPNTDKWHHHLALATNVASFPRMAPP